MTQRGIALESSDSPLAEAYDTALLDLDGVVYRGIEPIAHAAESLVAAAVSGMRFTYVTNNASRTPTEVAAVLQAVGVVAAESEIATSAQAAAALLGDRLPAGAPVLVVGGNGLRVAVAGRGFRIVESADDRPVAVVQGFSDATTYAMLAEAVLAIGAGALWVASNLDSTIPSARGVLPGNGALVEAVAHATGKRPLAAGKPERPLHDEAVRRTGATRPLVVGDRLDTDIDGALAVEVDSLLVLTGVTSLLTALAIPAGRRPSFVGADLRTLLESHQPVDGDGETVRCGAATAYVDGHSVVIGAGGPVTDILRAACAASWLAIDWGAQISAIIGLPQSLAELWNDTATQQVSS